MKDIVESERNTNGFVTIGLENHWSSWFKRWQMEKPGFTSLDSIAVTHKTKHKEQLFKIHPMWLPATENARPPTLNKKGLLKGVSFCLGHPFYRPQTWKEDIFEAK